MADPQTAVSCQPRFMKLVVADADETAQFYCEVFGMVKTRTLDLAPLVEVFLEWPDNPFQLVLVSYKQQVELRHGNTWGPIGFETDDIDGLTARALAAGAKVKIPAGTIDDLRYVILESPQGHEIELIQPLAA